ncbi:hypothetical protein NPIL_142711 [Nephila pilipes]|uniref:Uncharacterized protein n=1 Tax=Nephila pilipes TaxID=299642 RepID=A0A8X6U4I5_NEPPI|nr:hypothetical protein NPIL_142711 [Nephila pilipes]
MTRRAIQGRNAYAAWARKLGTTKKDDPEFLRVHEELRKSGENLDKVLTQMGDIPLFKLPASEKELDQLVENYKNLAKNQEEAVPKVVATPLRQDRPESASQGKRPTKRTRDSEGFISPPKHLTRKTPKANPNVQIAETMHIDANPDVDINTLDPVAAPNSQSENSHHRLPAPTSLGIGRLNPPCSMLRHCREELRSVRAPPSLPLLELPEMLVSTPVCLKTYLK